MATNKKKKKEFSFEEWSNANHGISKEQEAEDERKRQAYLSKQHDNDIAPVREDRTWFKESEGNWWQTILGSKTDVDEHLFAGLAGIGEKLVDAGAMLGAAMNQQSMMQAAESEMLFNAVTGKKTDGVLERYMGIQDEVEKGTAEFVAKDLYDEEAIAKAIISDPVRKIGIDSEKHSVFGEKSDDLAMSAGQLAGQVGVSMIPGVGQIGGTALMAATTFGSEAESAFQNGASFDEAMLSSTISTTAEILTEKIGGVKFGGKTLTDAAFGKLSSKVTSKFAKYLVSAGKLAADASAEAVEEVVSGYVSAWGQKLTYMDDKEIEELFTKEDALESAIGGFVLGGGFSVGEAAITGRDPASGLTKNEQAVVDKVVEAEIAKKEESGKKITNAEKTQIHESVVERLEHGQIDIDTIESVLGGDAYKAYKDTVTREDALRSEYEELGSLEKPTLAQQTRYQELHNNRDTFVNDDMRNDLRKRLGEAISPKIKGGKLVESYREEARRHQKFKADPTQYKDENARKTIQSIMDSGLANNTNEFHEVADWLASMSEQKGVVFNLTDKKALKGTRYEYKGRTTNAYFNEGTGDVALNIDSEKPLNSSVGHELGHVLKGIDANLYEEFKANFKAWANSKNGEWDARYKTTAETYAKRDADGNIIRDADGNIVFINDSVNIDDEVCNDLIGEYIFTNKDFVKHLSVKQPNVFKHFWDEIKYMVKVAKAGSKVEKELLALEKQFAEIWRETGKYQPKKSETTQQAQNTEHTAVSEKTDLESDDGIKHSLVVLDNGNVYVQASRKVINGTTVDEMRSEISAFFSDLLDGSSYIDIPTHNGDVLTITRAETADKARDNYKTINGKRIRMTDEEFAVKSRIESHIDEVAEVSMPKNKKGDEKNHSFARDGFTYRKAYFQDFDGQYYEVTLSIGNNGTVATVYNVGKIKESALPSAKILAVVGSKPLGKSLSENRIPHIPKNVNTDFSLSSDNEGKTLYTGSPNTNIQQFKVGGVEGSRQSGDRYGRGVYLTTNENTAKGYAGESGKVYEINADNLNIFNLNDSITDEMKATLQRELNGKDKQFRNSVLRNFRSKKTFTDFESAEQFFDEQRELWKTEDGYYAANKPEIKSANDKTGEAVIEYTDFANIENAIGNLTGNELYDALKSISTDDFASFITGHGFDGISFDEDANNQQYVIYRNEDRLNILNSESKDVQYSLSDTEGTQLSNEQSEYFADSKIRDENGNLKVMYHGTPNGDFTVFKDGTYFTEHKWYADLYQNPGASSLNSRKEATNPKTFKVYLDIKKPFDIADAEARSIYINDYIKGGNAVGINPYLSDAEYAKIDSIDWTEGEDLRDFLIDNGYDYDGIVLDEGAVGGYGDDVKYRGKSYVIFSPEQVKDVDNKNPTADPDIMFSLSNAVEETKDLMALHNLNASELVKTLELGGLPMPSIAVIKDEMGHEQYGDVSLILPKEAIDPAANKDNKVYGGDAWTPVYPKIEYKPNEKVAKKISDKYYELARAIGYDEVRPMYRYVNELEDSLNRDGGEAPMLEKLYDDTGMMNVYLQDSGKGKIEPITKETVTKISDGVAEMNQYFIDALGEDFVASYKAPDGVNGIEYRSEFMKQHEEKIRDAYKRYFMEEHGFTAEEVENVFENITKRDLTKIMRDAYMYTLNKGVTVRTETDHAATEDAIRQAASEGYKEWVDGLFKGIEEKTGIRNNQDYYTRSGNPRSWDALHWENTLENVIKVMKGQDETGVGSFSPFNTLFGASHKRYSNIQEIKADSARLGKINQDEYDAMKDEFSNRFAAIAESIKDPNERNPFIATDTAAEQIIEAVRSKKTKAGILNHLKSLNSQATMQTVDDVLSLVSDIANMPTGYFEAKPQRAVSLDEVGVFVIPRNADVKLKQELLNRGYSIAEYDPDVEGDRQRVVNRFEEYKFSLSDVGKQGSGDMPAPIGNYYVYGKDIKYTPYGGDIAPIGDGVVRNTTDTVQTSQNAVQTDVVADAPMLENIPVLPDDELAYGTIETIRPKPAEQPRLKKVDNTANKAHTAQVLVEEPKTEKRKQNIFHKAISNFVDKGAAVENLSLKTKNRALQDTYKAIGRSETKAQYFMENGTEGVKPLESIRAEVEKTGHLQDFYNYIYHRHNIDRMNLEAKERPNLERVTAEMGKLKLLNLQDNQLRAIASEKITKETSPKRANLIKTVQEYLASKDVKNKPVFDYSVTSEMSQELVNEYEANNPDFKRYAQDVYDYMNHLRKMMVYNGIISQETADLWAKMYPYYVPIRRAGDKGDAINVPFDTNRTGINAPIKGATGGNSDILPLFETMAQRTMQTFKAIDKNRFGIELMETLGGVTESTKTNIDEVLDSIDAHDDLLQKGKNGANPTFTVFENGERVTFEITDELYDALKPTSEGLMYTNKVLNTASNLHRGVLTEYSVPFMVKNAIKDAQDVLMNSQHPARTYANFPTAIKELTTKGKWYAEYMENGGGDNTYFDKKTNTFNKEKSAVRKIVGFPLDKISDANNFIEKIPRLAEYIASRKNGASVDAAMLDAARVTTDFSAGGDVTKFLNRNGATFLNASVQGFAQTVRNVREAKMKGLKGWLGLAAKCAITGLPAMMLNGLLWEDDEEYEELSDYVKENYYIVAKYGDGKFVRIPKGRTASVIQNGFEQVSNALTGDDEADFNRFFELFLSNLAPNNPIDNNIFAPIKQVATNKTWYGEDLVPTRLQDLPAAEQYDESTDAISKWLGENLNVSPYKINYLLNQYSGGVGDIFLPMLTPEAESGDDSLLGNFIAPLKDTFTTDSVMNNQNVSDFYDTADELTVNANSSYATDEDILKSKYFNSVKAEIGNLYKAKREIQNSNLSDKLKYQQVREIQKQIVSLSKNGLASYGDVIIDGNHAAVGDRHYKLNDEGEWQKISEEQVAKMEPFAKIFGGYSSYITYAGDLYNIKADKDEYGKSINGSRKEKVIDYLNNLDADYYTKILLLKSEYPSDDTYNYEIVNYINSLDGLTYEDRVAVLTELGFRVTADGQIYDD